jgi:hypothetical protein
MASPEREPADASRTDTSDAGAAGILVTSPVAAELRRLRQDDPAQARAVDEAIRHVRDGAGDPVRIDVPDAPSAREYRAIVPFSADAPVVIYRKLEPADGATGYGLVTTLLDRDQFTRYKRAEMSGLLDTPLVRDVATDVATSVTGTVSAALVNAPPGRAGTGR